MPHFSNRTEWNLTPNELTRRVLEHRRQGKSLIDLTEANPTRCGFDYPGEQILDAISQPESLVYNPTSKGLLAAREAVAQYYENLVAFHPDPEQLVLTSSTSEAYSFLFRLLAEPGDEILVPRPSYPLFDFLAQINDVRLEWYMLEYDHGWHLDFDSLQRARSPRTRAVLVVNPNNPTGSGIHLQERQKLLAFCREMGLPLISDEVFLDFGSTEGENLTSFAGTDETLTFCLSGISKMLGLPQMKLAWIVASGPSDWLTRALERLDVIADTYLSIGTPIQHALPRLLDALRPMIQHQIQSRLQTNLAALDERVARTGGLCRRLNLEGGWSAVISIPRTICEEEWVLRWLDQENVLVHPGYFFDFVKEGYAVLSLIPPTSDFQEGIDRMMSRIEKDLK